MLRRVLLVTCLGLGASPPALASPWAWSFDGPPRRYAVSLELTMRDKAYKWVPQDSNQKQVRGSSSMVIEAAGGGKGKLAMAAPKMEPGAAVGGLKMKPKPKAVPGILADGRLEGDVDDPMLGALLRLPKAALAEGREVSEPAEVSMAIGFGKLRFRGQRRTRFQGWRQVGGKRAAVLVTRLDLPSALGSDGEAMDDKTWAVGDFVQVFDPQGGGLLAARGRFRQRLDISETKQVRTTSSTTVNGVVTKEEVKMVPQTFELFFDIETYMGWTLEGLGDDGLGVGPFAGPSDRDRQARFRILEGEGIQHSKTGTTRVAGLSPERWVQWTLARLGAEVPADLAGQARAGDPVPAGEEPQPGDLLFYRKGKGASEVPGFVALAAGKGELAYIHPGKGWRKLPTSHKAFAPRFLFARRVLGR